MMSRSLWRGFDPPTTRPLPRSRNRLKESNVHYLFSVRNMFFYYLQDIFCKSTTTDLVALPHCDPSFWRFHPNQCTIQMLPFHHHALAGSSHDWKTRSVSRGNLAGAPAARSREHEVVPGACR